MASTRSIKACHPGIDKAKETLKLQGIQKKQLAENIPLSEGTINKFFQGGTIDIRNFKAICSKLGLIWQEIAGLPIPQEELVSEALQSDRPSYATDYVGSKNFTGRRDTLAAIHQALDKKTVLLYLRFVDLQALVKQKWQYSMQMNMKLTIQEDTAG
ncbi:hypothetical protein [Aetokthonos hydrillicola]|uniref:hypothetical protein n=1 Tax=Aetokthonos hydrillicola TaxID=1550245 RepID=UPI001ABB3F65|nr:hypothetical protein [Aetokthonos hydrillicola]MBO3462108.1 hypothetical protein [Aetokthonos hydrillicola CCALA 1050]